MNQVQEVPVRKMPRFFPSDLTTRERRIYVAATIYFLAVSAAMVWPVYPLFARIRPLVLGMPFSLAYLAVVLVVSFVVLLALYLWEGRRESRAPEARGPRVPPRGTAAGSTKAPR